jgi:osmoprotectant transport system substrate-binding protein
MKLARIAVPVAALLALADCGGDPLDEGGDGTGKGGPGETVTVGSANFPEAALLAEIYAGALEAKEIKVEKKLNIGSRETYIGAIDDGSIDLLPEYTGSLVGYLKKGGVQAKAPDEVYAELEGALPEGLIVLDKAAAEDKDAVVVTKATADKYQLKTIADLKPHAPNLVLGGPPEWRDRADGAPGLRQVYGLQFRQFKPLDVAGPLTVQALKGGDVDAANLSRRAARSGRTISWRSRIRAACSARRTSSR